MNISYFNYLYIENKIHKTIIIKFTNDLVPYFNKLNIFKNVSIKKKLDTAKDYYKYIVISVDVIYALFIINLWANYANKC